MYETLRWSAPEHKHVPKNHEWTWAVGVVAVSAAITALLLSDVLFALLIVVAAGTLALMAHRPARVVPFELSQKGITADEVHIPYQEALAFWVLEDPEEHVLLIETRRHVHSHLVIPINGLDPEVVREHLRPHITEKELFEPLSHKILEYFGF